MATQGLLTITKNKSVFIKVVCGWNGDCIPELKEKIESLPVDEITPELVHQQALEIVGGSDRLVTQYAKDKCIYNDASFAPKEGENYFESFENPNFNPRWDEGTADFVAIIDL